jgi:hypothetical protein
MKVTSCSNCSEGISLQIHGTHSLYSLSSYLPIHLGTTIGHLIDKIIDKDMNHFLFLPYTTGGLFKGCGEDIYVVSTPLHQQIGTLLAMPYRISTLQMPCHINTKYIQGD